MSYINIKCTPIAPIREDNFSRFYIVIFKAKGVQEHFDEVLNRLDDAGYGYSVRNAMHDSVISIDFNAPLEEAIEKLRLREAAKDEYSLPSDPTMYRFADAKLVKHKANGNHLGYKIPKSGLRKRHLDEGPKQ